MHNINTHDYEDKVNCLPEIAWILLAVGLVPHVLEIIGSHTAALIACYICFPISMGPFALAHGYLLINRLGLTSHMAWISVITFSLIWSAILCQRCKRKMFT